MQAYRLFTVIITLLVVCMRAAAQEDVFVFPEAVEPLLSTEWGQEYPYNRKCPTIRIDSIDKHVYAGCGPLVMSQTIRYFKQPPSNRTSKNKYHWELLPDRSSDTTALEKQDAVAQLIRDCGIAACTNYTSTASSTKLNGVVTGLKKSFGYNRYMHIVDRSYYSGKDGSRAWKNLIFNELKAGRPVIIRGEKSKWNAHVFIIDGCRDSTVHINLGWSGRHNGYYDPDSLYGYSQNQRMVIGIAPANRLPVTKHIHVDKPGQLAYHITDNDRLYMKSLKVTGNINRDDIRTLRLLAGGTASAADKTARKGNVSALDLSGCVILTLPDSAFYGCDNLTYVALPLTLPEISSCAFAGCTKLNEVRFYPLIYEIKQRAFSGCFNLISLSLPKSLRIIGANAFNSCTSLTEVVLPQNVTSVGSGAFANDTRLQSLTVPKTLKLQHGNITQGTKVKQIKRL
ncbi:MAG: C10 family peptidase [Prevotella sp.]